MEGANFVLSLERRPMAGKDGIEIERVESFERSRPFIHLGVGEVGKIRLHQVARAHNTFLRKKNEEVGIRMAAPEIEELNFMTAPGV